MYFGDNSSEKREGKYRKVANIMNCHKHSATSECYPSYENVHSIFFSFHFASLFHALQTQTHSIFDLFGANVVMHTDFEK